MKNIKKSNEIEFFSLFYNVEPTKLIYGIKKHNENEFFCFFFIIGDLTNLFSMQ